MALPSRVFNTPIDWYTPYAQSAGISQASRGWLLFVYQAVAVMTNRVSIAVLKKLKDERLFSFISSLAILYRFAGVAALTGDRRFRRGASMVTCLSLFTLRAADRRQAAALAGTAQCLGYGVAAAGPLLLGMLHQYRQNWMLPLSMVLAANVLQRSGVPLAGCAKLIGRSPFNNGITSAEIPV